MRFWHRLVFLATCWAEIDVSFANTAYTGVFTEQWSYDQHTTDGHNKHFDIGEYSGRQSLRARIYHDDKALSKSSDTCPRTELSQTDKKNGLKTEVDYVAQWDWQLMSYTEAYQFAFMQLFGGNGPNIMLRYVRNTYNILCEECGTDHTLPGNATADVGKWITWRVEFRLSSAKGHVRVHRDGKPIHSYDGKTSDGSNHHFKLGLYTQHKPCEAKDVTSLLSNLTITP
jgi:hypothetical protein